MKFALMLSVALTTFAIAPASADSDKPISLTMTQVMTLDSALHALDGHTKVIQDGQRETIVQEAYQLGAGLRLVIAQDETMMDAAMVSLRAAISELQVQAGPDADKADTPANLKFIHDQNVVMEQKSSYDLVGFHTKELNLDANPIPPSVLSGLSPIRKD